MYAESKESNWKSIDIIEIKRLIGTLILLGVYQSKNEPVRNLWDYTNKRFNEIKSFSEFIKILKI